MNVLERLSKAVEEVAHPGAFETQLGYLKWSDVRVVRTSKRWYAGKKMLVCHADGKVGNPDDRGPAVRTSAAFSRKEVKSFKDHDRLVELLVRPRMKMAVFCLRELLRESGQVLVR